LENKSRKKRQMDNKDNILTVNHQIVPAQLQVPVVELVIKNVDIFGK